MPRELTKEEIEAFYAEQEKKTASRKPVEPRSMTPDQVRAEAGVQQMKNDDAVGQWPEHESIVLEKEKRVSKWEEGVHEAVIERAWSSEGKDFYHTDENGEPKTTTFLHVGFVTEDGMRIQKRMTLNYNERSTLSALTAAIFGTPPDSISTDDLMGKKIRILVKNKVNERGDEWETIVEFLASTKQFKAGGGV